VFNALYSGDPIELETLCNRLTGPVAWSYWGALVCNFVPLQLLWSGRLRRDPRSLFAISLTVAVGMWLERYMLLVTTLSHHGLVSSWGHYFPSLWEWTLYAGSIGLFLTAFLLFVRFLPIISASELKADLKVMETGRA
jgi:molybdopterin-containing oxidoreductase family membrane subunit